MDLDLVQCSKFLIEYFSHIIYRYLIKYIAIVEHKESLQSYHIVSSVAHATHVSKSVSNNPIMLNVYQKYRMRIIFFSVLNIWHTSYSYVMVAFYMLNMS